MFLIINAPNSIFGIISILLILIIAYKNITHVPLEKKKISSLKRGDKIEITLESGENLLVEIAHNDPKKGIFYWTSYRDEGITASIFNYTNLTYVRELKKQ